MSSDLNSIQAYSESFYAGQQKGSSVSAAVIVPLVLSVIPARSVIDIGCGVGGWLGEFRRHGVEDVLGVDGDYVPLNALKIPREQFEARDLRQYSGPDRRFDLACSLEVAEHLPADAAESFVAALVRAAPVILFSAAVPGQGGTDHVNEQWQSYWSAQFATHGYVCLDFVRPAVFYDERVEWWYRQNALVFCRPEHRPESTAPITSRYEIDRVHPELLKARMSEPPPQSGRQAVASIAKNVGFLGKVIKQRIGA